MFIKTKVNPMETPMPPLMIFIISQLGILMFHQPVGTLGLSLLPSATSYSPQPTYTPPPSKSVHTVSKGDTLYSISRNYGTTVAALRQANGINGSLIRIGERIMIP